MGALYIVFAVCYFIINTGSMLKGAAKITMSRRPGGGLGVNEIVVGAMTVMFILYSFVGGLVAAAWTDLFQGILIIVLSFMLIPTRSNPVGGIDGMQASLEPFRFSLATPSGIGPWVIAMLTINGLVGIMAQPHQFGDRRHRERRADVPDRHALRATLVKRVCTVGWALVGLIVAAMIAQGKADGAALGNPENAFGFACRQLLFPVPSRPDDRIDDPRRQHVDLLGVSRRQRRPVHRRAVSAGACAESSWIATTCGWVGISGLVITMLGVVYALFLIESVLYTFLLTETLATFVGISLLGGILWRRANRWGAAGSLACALAATSSWCRIFCPDSGSTIGTRTSS